MNGGSLNITNNTQRNYYAPVSLTAAGTLATGTLTNPHILATGDSVLITQASRTNYNGTFVVTVTGPNTFTYSMAGSPGASDSGAVSLPGKFIVLSNVVRANISGNSGEYTGGDFIDLQNNSSDISVNGNRVTAAQGSAYHIEATTNNIQLTGNKSHLSQYGVTYAGTGYLQLTGNDVDAWGSRTGWWLRRPP